jgi:hypothetical protein
MDRTKMLAGDPAPTMIMFNLPSSCDGHLAADCDSDFPSDTTPCPVAYLTSNSVKIYDFNADWTTPANSTFTLNSTISITPFSSFGWTRDIPQKGTSVKIDAFSRKFIMHRMPFRKFNDHWSMLLSTTVKLSNPTSAGIRWMELRNDGTAWSLYQEGTYAPDNNFRFMGSIAMDSLGNIALGYSISSSTMYPSIRYTGRVNGDPLGVMTIGERGIFNGTGSQTAGWKDGRWGDYSAMVADPVEIGKFWYTQEYILSEDWKTRIASFSWADILAVDATATPDKICSPEDTVQLNVIASGGSGVYTYSWTSDPPGFTSDIQNPVVYPTETTKYIATVDDGTQTKSDTVTVELNTMPNVFAGNDTAYCWWIPIFSIIGSAENYSSVKWTTAGDGYFNYEDQLLAFYHPGYMDGASGSVTLTLTAYALEPCQSDSVSDEIFVDLVCTGTTQPENDKFAVSMQPNPSSGNFFISISGVKDQTVYISILDLRGKTVYQEELKSLSNALTKKIDLSTLAKGTYLVQVKTDKEQKIDKIVIQ